MIILYVSFRVRVISSGARNLMKQNDVIPTLIRFLTFVRNDNKEPELNDIEPKDD